MRIAALFPEPEYDQDSAALSLTVHSGDNYNLLSLRGHLYMLAGDIAKNTGADYWDLIDTCEHDQQIEYPSAAIPYHVKHAVPGVYFSFTSAIDMVSSLGVDAFDIHELHVQKKYHDIYQASRRTTNERVPTEPPTPPSRSRRSR